MKFVSTDPRDVRQVTCRHTLVQPIPSTGHLWMPENIANIHWPPKDAPLKMFIDAVMKTFGPDCWNTSFLTDFTFQPTLVRRWFRNRELFELQLWHGETESFKDVGCFVAAKIYNHLFDKKNHRVVVATSGDTGGAVAAACAKENG